MTNWEPILMAGLGAAAFQIDPNLPLAVLTANILRAFIGAAVGAYFGNHTHAYREKKRLKKKEAEKENE